ncbi:unnamed protein product, partial [Mesorhabditis spiculigera]
MPLILRASDGEALLAYRDDVDDCLYLIPEDAKEKLREECIEFNQYNKGATKMDLLTDSIWRPEGYRLSPWRRGAGRDPRGITYPSELSLF